ncbi:methyltransferase [Pseudomonas sp. Marseille-QA0892]
MTTQLPTAPIDASASLAALGRYLKEQGYHFVTPTPLTHQRNLDRDFHLSRDLRDAFGWNRPFDSSLIPASLSDPLWELGFITTEADGRYRSRIRFSSLGDNLLVHSGFPTDAKDAVFFGPDTYRFVAAIQRHLDSIDTSKPRRVVDICSGTGAGAFVLAGALPDAEVWGTDLSQNALLFMAANAEVAGLTRVHRQESDVLKALEGTFDLITANPPYMADVGNRAYRDGGDDLGASLSVRIAKEAIERLAPGGTLLLYTGTAIVGGRDTFRAGLDSVLQAASVTYTYAELDPDVFGEDLLEPAYASAHVERIAVVLLTVTRALQ